MSPSIRKKAAIRGALAHRSVVSARLSSTDIVKATRTCWEVKVSRCTIAGPTPSCEKMELKPTTSSAAATIPKAIGETSRARTITTKS